MFFPLSRFLFLGSYYLSPAILVMSGFFWLYNGNDILLSSFFFLFDGQFETLRTPEPDRMRDRKNLEGTPSFPPLLNSKDPPLVRKESAPYTPVPPILSPSASQGRG